MTETPNLTVQFHPSAAHRASAVLDTTGRHIPQWSHQSRVQWCGEAALLSPDTHKLYLKTEIFLYKSITLVQSAEALVSRENADALLAAGPEQSEVNIRSYRIHKLSERSCAMASTGSSLPPEGTIPSIGRFQQLLRLTTVR